MITRRRLIVAIIALALIAGTVFRLTRLGKGKASVEERSAAIPVTVSPAIQEDVEDILSYTGNIRGANEARVYPRVPGKLLRKVKDAGDTVKKDEVIALVDRDEPALKFSPSDVRSPLNGILTRYYVDIGEAVLPQAPIAQVAEVEKVKVVIDIPEQDIPRVKLGQTARIKVDAFPLLKLQGIVSRISQAVDMASRTAEVEVSLDNPDKSLKPGLFARVELIISVHRGAITIPREALSETMEKEPYVFVVNDGKAERRPIITGVILTDKVEVTNGLSEGLQVVTVGRHLLTNGSRIEIYKDSGGSR